MSTIIFTHWPKKKFAKCEDKKSAILAQRSDTLLLLYFQKCRTKYQNDIHSIPILADGILLLLDSTKAKIKWFFLFKNLFSNKQKQKLSHSWTTFWIQWTFCSNDINQKLFKCCWLVCLNNSSMSSACFNEFCKAIYTSCFYRHNFTNNCCRVC